MLWVVAALAGPLGDQRVEESRVAMAEARYDAARALALEALRLDPRAWAAWRLYLRASQRTGLEAVALAELAAADDAGAAVARAWWQVVQGRSGPDALQALDDPRARIALGWTRLGAGDAEGALALELPREDPLAARLRLRALATLGRAGALGVEGDAWLREHPEHPDVLAELFGETPAPAGVQRRVLRSLAKQAATGDVRWLLLALRTAIAADATALAADLCDRLEAAGHPRPLERAPWGDSMLRAMGRALAGYEAPVIPPASPAERLAIVDALARQWLAHDRVDDAVALWGGEGGFDGAWEAAFGRAQALRAAGREAAAHEQAQRAMQATVQAWPDDPCGTRVSARLRAAYEIERAFGVPLPDVLTEAAAGRFEAWAEQATTPTLRWCLAARSGAVPDAAPFLDGRVAAGVLRDLPAADALGSAPSRARLPQVGDPFPAGLLAQARGEGDRAPTVVTVWASWCGPCQQELPELDAGVAAWRRAGRPVHWLALSLDDQEPPYRRALQRLALDAPVVARMPEAKGSLAIGEVPTTWLVGPDGRVTWVRSGYDAALVRALDEALARVEAR